MPLAVALPLLAPSSSGRGQANLPARFGRVRLCDDPATRGAQVIQVSVERPEADRLWLGREGRRQEIPPSDDCGATYLLAAERPKQGRCRVAPFLALLALPE